MLVWDEPQESIFSESYVVDSKVQVLLTTSGLDLFTSSFKHHLTNLFLHKVVAEDKRKIQRCPKLNDSRSEREIKREGGRERM